MGLASFEADNLFPKVLDSLPVIGSMPALARDAVVAPRPESPIVKPLLFINQRGAGRNWDL